MASRKLREPSTAVYQFGRGSEPMIEVGRAIPADALYIVSSLVLRPSLPSSGSGKGKAGIIVGCAAQKSYASLFGATSLTSERSGAGSGSPESRKRFTIG